MKSNNFKLALSFIATIYAYRADAVPAVQCAVEKKDSTTKPAALCDANKRNILFHVKKRFPQNLSPAGCLIKSHRVGGFHFLKEQVDYYGPDVLPECTDDDVLGSMSEG